MDNIVWLPAIAMPVPFDIPGRIKELRSYMEPDFPLEVPKEQHINIKAIIKLYEDGQIDGTKEIFVKDGKIVPHEETLKGPTYSWAEGGIHYQMQDKHAYGSGPFPPNFHEICMLVRLIPELGGDGSVTGIIAMNDTGSDNLTLFTTDPIFVGGGIIGYRGRLGVVNLMDANGIITPFQRLQVQVKLVRDDNTPWGQWITESAIVRVPSPNLPRLSGIGIRQALYIGTAPGNHLLAVSTTRGGLSSLL